MLARNTFRAFFQGDDFFLLILFFRTRREDDDEAEKGLERSLAEDAAALSKSINSSSEGMAICALLLRLHCERSLSLLRDLLSPSECRRHDERSPRCRRVIDTAEISLSKSMESGSTDRRLTEREAEAASAPSPSSSK